MTNSVNRIQELREARGWHRSVVAAKFNVGERTIRRWEDEATAVPSTAIPVLADIFETSPEYLMGWDRDSTPTTGVGA
jgi:DNA-binding transcriptional regulator YiaG